MNRDAIAYMHDALDKFSIECDWSAEGKIHAAASGRGERCLDTFADALRRIGEPYSWYDGACMREIVGSDYYSKGLYAPGAVLLQPAAYLKGLASGLSQFNHLTIYENSPVVEAAYGSAGHVFKTSNGEIRAKNVILANNGFIGSFGFFEREVIPVYTFASLTRKLTETELETIGGRATYGLIPADPFGTTIRKTADNRLFVRNVYAYANRFDVSPSEIVRARRSHQKSFDRRYPGISKIGFQHSWGGALCLAQNGGMVFGQVHEGIFAAAFCNGTGVARGAAFGKAIAEHALGHRTDTIDLLLRRAKPRNTYPRVLINLGVKLTTWFRLARAGREV